MARIRGPVLFFKRKVPWATGGAGEWGLGEIWRWRRVRRKKVEAALRRQGWSVQVESRTE